MGTTPDFSIVISAYNAANDLPGMLQSLLTQTYHSFEVIVIDDAATDATGEVAESYRGAFRGKGVDYVVIHKTENEGLSAARNTGMSHAAGEYILFFDADDTVENETLTRIAATLDEYSYDFLLFGYTEDYYDKKNDLSYSVKKSPLLSAFGKEGEKSLAEAYPYLMELEHETMFGYAWNKAYRLVFLREHQLQFSPIVHIEDVLFNLRVADCMTSFVTIPDLLYHYANRGQQRLTGKYLPEYFSLQKKRIRAFIEMEERAMKRFFVNGIEGKLNEIMAAAYFRAFLSSMVRRIQHGDVKGEILRDAKKELQDSLYQRLRGCLHSEEKSVRLLYAPFAEGRIEQAYRRARLVAFAQTHAGGLYARLKQKR